MMLDKKSVVITAAVRTAIGAFQGFLKEMSASNLGALVIKAAIEKSNLNPTDIDELIMGQVLTGGAGQNPARQAAIQAGLPHEKTAYIINQVCGSGLRAISAGYQSIMTNDSKIIIAGGSAVPRQINFEAFRKIANKINAILHVDMAHFAGLVAAGEHPNPLKFADVVTTTTHKTLFLLNDHDFFHFFYIFITIKRLA